MRDQHDNRVLSVCIPAYNEEDDIGKSIETISEELSRAGVPFEFVIANDNSKQLAIQAVGHIAAFPDRFNKTFVV